MKIQKTKIHKLESNLPKSLENKSIIASVILDITKDKQTLVSLGFTQDLKIGETLLPPALGATSRFNAEGKKIIDKSQPKKTIYQDFEWTRDQWDGYRQTKKVTSIITRSRKVWHRNMIPAPSVEITISKKEDNAIYITTPLVDFTDSESAIHNINLILELFGSCDVLTEDGVPIIKNHKQLNWEILPPGKRPWKEQKKFLDPILKKIKSKNTVSVFEKRLKDIDALDPDGTSIGKNGYQGYVIFHFDKKNIHVLESIFYGNALYIFNEDWQILSQKSKAEILNSGSHIERFTHHGDRIDIIDKIKNLLK